MAGFQHNTAIPNKLLQYQFVKCFASVNMGKQDETLTGVKNTASSCLITQPCFQFYIQLAAFPLCTWGPGWRQSRQACFAVIPLLIVRPSGRRIPLPSVIPAMSPALRSSFMSSSLRIAGTADGVPLSFRDSAHIRSGGQWITHTPRSPGSTMDSLISVNPN